MADVILLTMFLLINAYLSITREKKVNTICNAVHVTILVYCFMAETKIFPL